MLQEKISKENTIPLEEKQLISLLLVLSNNCLPLSFRKLCTGLDISKTCAYDLIDQGILKPHYLGNMRKPYFKVQDVINALIEKEKKS